MSGKAIAKPNPRGRFRIDPVVVTPFVVFFLCYMLMPRFVGDKALNSLVYIGINVLLALGLNLLMGYAGQISLGHAAFFGLGAYSSAIITLQPIQSGIIPGFSAGVGLMAGVAALMSLTKASGWKLAAGVGGLIVLSWICRATHLGLPVTLVVTLIGMAACGYALKIGWWRSMLAGLINIAALVICARFLQGALARSAAGIETSPWIAMLAGVLLTGLIAYLIGAQVLRLKGNYLAMGTLAFGVIVEIMLSKWVAVTGGSSEGIYGIPTIAFVDGLPGPVRRIFEFARGGSLDAQQQYFYLVWLFVFVALILAVNIVRSRVGRAFRAVHGSEQAAESLGVDTGRYKVQVFVLSAALASIAGSLHAHNAGVGYISPSEFNFLVSVQLVVIVVIGGLASVWGALLGASAIQLIKNWILTLDKANISIFGLALKGLDPIVFGGILVLVMMLMPQGLTRGLTDAIVGAIRRTKGLAQREVS